MNFSSIGSELSQAIITQLQSLPGVPNIYQRNRPFKLRIGSGQNNHPSDTTEQTGGSLDPWAKSLASDFFTPLHIHRFHITERANDSEPLTLQLLCVATRSGLTPAQLLGQPIQLQMVTDQGNARTVNALITHAQSGPDDGGLQTWMIEARDAFSLMGAGRNSRLFLRKSVIDITEIILREWIQKIGGHVDFDMSLIQRERYPVREMVLQWNESDSAFIERHLRKHAITWGIRSHPETTGPIVHTLVLCDNSYSLPVNSAASLRYHVDASVQDRDAITVWSPTATLQPGVLERRSWDYKTQRPSQTNSPTMLDYGSTGNSVSAALLDHHIDPPHWSDNAAEAVRLTDLRMQHHEMQASLIQGASGARDATVLTRVQVLDAPGTSLNKIGPASPAAGNAQNEVIFIELEHWGQNNLPKELSQGLDILFTRQGWQIQRPSIGPHDENRRYANSFTAVPRLTPIVPAFDRHLHWPVMQPIHGVVVCPAGEEVYCDAHGRVKVHIPGLRVEDHEHAQGAGTSHTPADSAWTRVARSVANQQGGELYTPRRGDEVLLGFVDGDPDKMLITHCLHSPVRRPTSFHNSDTLPGNRYLSGTRAKEVNGQNATHLLHDSTPRQTSLQGHADHAYSQLTLGHLNDPRRAGKANPRGEGAELRTDAAAAIRAAKGILVSAWARLEGSGTQLDYDEALSLMQAGMSLFKSMGEYAAQHQGLALKPDGQSQLTETAKNWQSGSNIQPHSPGQDTGIVAITSPQGITQNTSQSHVTTAGHNIDAVAMHNLQQVAGQLMNLHAGKGMSLFAHDGGIQSIAHQGSYLMQSQNGPTVIESGQTIDMQAKDALHFYGKVIHFTAQDGSYIEIGNGGVTIGTKDGIVMHCASFAQTGPDSRPISVPAFSKGKMHDPHNVSHFSD